MTHSELVDWMAYDRIEPFGYHIENFRAGKIWADLSNLLMAKGQKARRPIDFMPEMKQDPRSEEERQQALDAKIKNIFMSMPMVNHGS